MKYAISNLKLNWQFHFFQERRPARVALQTAQQRIAFHLGQAGVALFVGAAIWKAISF
jgi:hypothetical protein